MAKKQSTHSPAPSSAPIYQLKITLKGASPPIWRRVLVPSDYTLMQLHAVIQVSMGWTNSHLHQFIVTQNRRVTYISDPRFELDDDGVLDEGKVKLSQVVSKVKGKISYEYDFGDSWEHEILLEKIPAPEAGVPYPQCTAGKRACPPDDIGGVWGYMEMLDALENPDDPENEELLEMVDENFDPEAFDPEEVNAGFKNMGWVFVW